MNGVVERRDDLDFHSGLDVDAVAAFAAFGSYSVECHNQFSFSCYSFSKASNKETIWSNYVHQHVCVFIWKNNKHNTFGGKHSGSLTAEI